MVQHIFPSFLDSPEEYDGAEAFWKRLVDEVAVEQHQDGEWKRWQSRFFLDGSPTPRDGNPIYDARSDRLGRAVRIIQTPPESDELELAGWIDTFDYSDSGGPPFTEELVLNLSLSAESADAARSLLRQWMDRSTSRERMEDVLGSHRA